MARTTTRSPLLVEDEDAISRPRRPTFEQQDQLDHRIRVHSGQDAVEARRHPVRLRRPRTWAPEIDGFEVCRQGNCETTRRCRS